MLGLVDFKLCSFRMDNVLYWFEEVKDIFYSWLYVRHYNLRREHLLIICWSTISPGAVLARKTLGRIFWSIGFYSEWHKNKECILKMWDIALTIFSWTLSPSFTFAHGWVGVRGKGGERVGDHVSLPVVGLTYGCVCTSHWNDRALLFKNVWNDIKSRVWT